MRNLCWILLLVFVFLSGCGGKYFKVAEKDYQERVKTLGVLPLLVDENSTILHPDRMAILQMLRENNTMKEDRLIDILKDQRNYFDVRPIPGDPRQLFNQLVVGSALTGQGDTLAKSYTFNPQKTAELAVHNVVDGLLVVILYGQERTETRWDRTHLLYLKAPFNNIQATAFVVLPNGQIVWEFPGKAGESFLQLQYPDFDEAHYNNVDTIQIKFVTKEGLERVVTEKDRGMLGGTSFEKRYEELFNRVASALKPSIATLLQTGSTTSN